MVETHMMISLLLLLLRSQSDRVRCKSARVVTIDSKMFVFLRRFSLVEQRKNNKSFFFLFICVKKKVFSKRKNNVAARKSRSTNFILRKSSRKCDRRTSFRTFSSGKNAQKRFFFVQQTRFLFCRVAR